jgi:hypothetical protein
MADNTDNSGNEKKPVLKSVFQWAAAIAAPFGCESPQFAYNQAGATYDYLKLKRACAKAPKPAQ